MDNARYRCIVQFDSEKQVYRARAPELGHCSAEGATRAEALAKLEEEMDAQLTNIRERGGEMPRPVDGEEFSGEVQARISKSLHRELVFQARSEGIEVDQLVSEILAAGVEARRAGRAAGRRNAGSEERQGEGWRGREAGRQGGSGRYYEILEDRANFIEYVRALDQGATGHGGQPRHGRRRRGGGGGGGQRPGQDGP